MIDIPMYLPYGWTCKCGSIGVILYFFYKKHPKIVCERCKAETTVIDGNLWQFVFFQFVLWQSWFMRPFIAEHGVRREEE